MVVMSMGNAVEAEQLTSDAVNQSSNNQSILEPSMLHGQLCQVPDDLYIPPDYMRVLLETFQGPLDLLLYLIRKNKINIVDLNVASITQQYMEYIALMKELKVDLAAEYLLMAATLIDIKSRMLLPSVHTGEEDDSDIDPRAELIRRLQIYEQFRLAAMDLDDLDRCDRDFYRAHCVKPSFNFQHVQPICHLEALCDSLVRVESKTQFKTAHRVGREVLSVRERMIHLLDTLSPKDYAAFTSLYQKDEGAMGVVVSFLAILELQKQRALHISQSGVYETIYVKKTGIEDED